MRSLDNWGRTHKYISITLLFSWLRFKMGSDGQVHQGHYLTPNTGAPSCAVP